MTELAGRVVVVAGAAATIGPIAAALHAAGAKVALIAADAARTDVTVHFRADPADGAVWDRVSMHVEQHLGPVDAAVTDATCDDAVRAAFGADLARRGHGGIVVVDPGDDPADVVRQVAGTQ